MLAWLQTLPQDRTWLSILTLAELDQGIEALPPGDPRRERYQRFRAGVEAQFAGRILSLDDDTVQLSGAISGRARRETGSRVPVVDTLLAAQRRRHRLYLATRNLADVRHLGWPCFDPWTSDPADFPLTG